MRPRGNAFRFLLGVVVRASFVIALVLGLFTSAMLISAETLTTLSGSVSLTAGRTIAAGETLELAPDVDTTITLGGNLIVQGTLRSKPAPGVTHVIRFIGIDESKFVGGGNEPVASDVGLWVTGEGKLDLSGPEKLAWTRAAASLPAGATSAVLEAVPAGWQAGDEILVAPTEAPNVAGFSTHHEVRTLTSVSGSTVGFGSLSFAHPRVTVKPDVSYGAEIVNLTRSVRIEGQDATHRTHVWIKSGVPQSIRNVAIRYAGPQKGSPAESVLGRYGLHFHRMGEGSGGSLVEGVVVRQTGGPGFAVHASNGVTLRKTVAHDIQSVAYWYDPGATEAPNDTLYDGALASHVRPTPKQGSAHRLTAFLLGRGTGNACLGCVAFGVQGGKNASGFSWPEGEVGIWRFEDVLAHNNARNGIFVWQNATGGHFVDRFTAYYNGSAGIEHGAYTNAYHYRDSVLYANKSAGVILYAASSNQAPPLSFERPYIDGGGITSNAVLLAKPTNLDQPPTLWCGATILGLKAVPFLVGYTGADATIVERLLILPVCPSDLSPDEPSVPVPPPPSPRGAKSTAPSQGPSAPANPPPAPSPSAAPGRGGTPPPKQGR
ncbi:MAG: hypothetical protein WEB06_15530 [Actinomycetota bacterium]